MCSDPPKEGFIIERKLNPDGQFTQPEIETSSCEAILSCTKFIFTLGFAEFHSNSYHNLTKVVETFEEDIGEMNINIVNASAKLSTEQNLTYVNNCSKYLTLYTKFADSFYNMVDLLNQTTGENNHETLYKATLKFQAYLNSCIGEDKDIDFKKEVLANCFWFEKYFWWRFTDTSQCYLPVITEGVTLDRSESLYLAEIKEKLQLGGKLHTYCLSLPRVVGRESLESTDPYYVKAELCRQFPPGSSIYEELSAVPTEGPVDDFPAPAELDPNNPLFQAIEKISCYFYPLTKPAIPI